MDFSVIWENKEEIKINIWEHAANMKTLQRLCQQKETKYFVQSKTSYQNLVDFLNFNNMRNEFNFTNKCKETMINERNVLDMKRLSEEFESNKIEEAVCEFLKSNEDYSKVISYLQIENEGNIEDNRILEEIISQNLLQIYQRFPKLLHKLSFSQLDRIFSSFSSLSSNFLESKITANNEQSIIFDIIEYLYSSNRNQNLNEKEKEIVPKEKSQMFLLFQHVNFNLIDDERTFIFLKHLEQFEKNNFFLSNLVDKLHQRITSKESEIESMKNEYSSRIDFLEHELDNIKMQFLEIQQNISKHQQENEEQVKKHIQEHNKEHEKLINNIEQIDRDLNDKLKNYQTIYDEMKQKNKEYEQNLENQLSQIQEQKQEITRLENSLTQIEKMLQQKNGLITKQINNTLNLLIPHIKIDNHSEKDNQGILYHLHSLIKNKFDRKYIISLSSNNIYDIIDSSSSKRFGTCTSTKSRIYFEFQEKIQINGMIIKYSFHSLPISFYILIDDKIVKIIENTEELNGKYQKMEIYFSEKECQKIEINQTDEIWYEDNFGIIFEYIDFLSPNEHYWPTVFKSMLKKI